MCNCCVKEEYPDRNTICLDNGSYILNYEGCAKCGERSLEIKNRIVSEEEDELVTYLHVCPKCDHEVAEHVYVFKVSDEYQKKDTIIDHEGCPVFKLTNGQTGTKWNVQHFLGI